MAMILDLFLSGEQVRLRLPLGSWQVSAGVVPNETISKEGEGTTQHRQRRSTLLTQRQMSTLDPPQRRDLVKMTMAHSGTSPGQHEDFPHRHSPLEYRRKKSNN